MNAVFADAGYWIALFNPRDQLHTKAITVSNSLQGRPMVTSQMVLTEFLNHYAAALTLYAQRPDKEWGLTDCASFLIMQERGITEALAHDDHFQQAGFVALLRDR